VAEAPGLAAYAASFAPIPAMPAVGSISVVLDVLPADPALAPRGFTLALPRDPDPAQANQPGSLFRPVRIALLPTPLASPAGLAAALAVTVRRADDSRRIEGALVRLRPEGGLAEARAMTDAAGDALLLVPGVPLASPGAGAIVRAGIDAALDVVVDPLLARFHRPDDVPAARAAAARRTASFIDPDDLAARLGAAAAPPQLVQIQSGQTRTAGIAWTP
jgi:hypothetical protein